MAAAEVVRNKTLLVFFHAMVIKLDSDIHAKPNQHSAQTYYSTYDYTHSAHFDNTAGTMCPTRIARYVAS